VSTLPTVVSSHAQPTTGSGEPKTPALAGADTSVLTFVNRKATITVPVAACKLERTIEGASSITVTIHDPTLSFFNSDAIAAPKHGYLESFVTLDNQVFAIAGIHLLKGHMVEVTLEDEAIYRLRKNRKPLTMSRGSVTRAQFIKHMFAESGVELDSPELRQKQTIESVAEAETRAEKNKKHKPGLSAHSKLTIKNQPIDPEQRANLETALEQATKDSAGHLATLALICAGIGESTFRKGEVAHSQNGAQVGVWQSDVIPADQVAEQAHYFLIGGKSFQEGGAIHLAKTQPTLTPGEIATMVEKSGEPGDFYNVYKDEAQAAINAFTGFDAGALSEGTTFAKEYQYERRFGEDTWECARRLADEVNWYLFIVDGAGHFHSGTYLKRSMPLMLVAPGADGLIGNPTIGFMTSPKYDDTVNVECHAAKWAAPPGSTAELAGYGQASGIWFVTAITRERMKSSVTVITLGRVKPPKKEPPHEVGTLPEALTAEGGRGTALAAYGAAGELSKLKLEYGWGGGHGAHELAKVANGGLRLDCSGAVSWVLWKVGMHESDTGDASTVLGESWGEAGEGKYMTVWANAEHVFIEFKIPGKPHSRLDTVPWPGEENGPRLRPFSPLPETSTHNFTARRWPGQ
jgi:hypothetical protein